MTKPFRIIDTGVREGRANIAFDAALIEERQADRVPDTIRFLRFPPTALIGRHQDLSREIDHDFCAENGIGTVRRVTGGGAIYLDEGQLGWELVFNRASLGIAALPDQQRVAVERYCLHEQSLEDVASEMGITKDAVRGLLFRGRKMIRSMMGDSTRWFSRR